MFAERGLELVICSSFSKNFGLYNERRISGEVASANINNRVLKAKITS